MEEQDVEDLIKSKDFFSAPSEKKTQTGIGTTIKNFETYYRSIMKDLGEQELKKTFLRELESSQTLPGTEGAQLRAMVKMLAPKILGKENAQELLSQKLSQEHQSTRQGTKPQEDLEVEDPAEVESLEAEEEDLAVEAPKPLK